MRQLLFNRFLVDISISRNDLWWTDSEHNLRYWHLIDISIVGKTIEGEKFKGLQFIFLGFSMRIADILNQ